MRVTKDELAEYGLCEGDLLVNRVNSRELVGKAAVIPSGMEPSVFESKNIRVRLNKDRVRPKFINYQLLSGGRRHFANNAQQVVGMASISQKQLMNFPIVLKDIEQQDRIVAEIEKQFSRLDEAVANLKRYKAAVLKAAVEGRLVPTEAELARQEGRTYETGEQLLARALNERRTAWEKQNANVCKMKYVEPQPPETSNLPELPEGWAWAPLEMIGQEGRPIIYGIIKPGPHVPDGVPYVRVTEMKNGRVDLESLRRTSRERAAKSARATLQAGDVLYTTP